MENYLEMKRRHEKEVNSFPMMFAFNNEQFKEGMEKLGLKENETDKIYSIGGGGYIRRSDSKSLSELMNKHDREFDEAVKESDDFIFEMFDYELSNHEYCVTYDVSDTLRALGFTHEEVKANSRLSEGLKKAIKNQKTDW